MILDRVRTQLIDINAVQRWTDTELLKWLSDGLRTVVGIVPSAASSTAIQALVQGTKQAIPANGYMLFSVVRNCNSDGSQPGRAVRITDRELLDAQNPDWHTATPSSAVTNYVFDPQEPDIFYVYPPNDGAGFVQLSYAVQPTELAATTDTIPLKDLYLTPLVDYVLFRAYQKDSDFGAGMAQAQMYLQLFMAFFGQSESAQKESNPNLQLTPFNPDVKGAAS
jgi:hypothetical protein